jgi:hypothetical protein
MAASAKLGPHEYVVVSSITTSEDLDDKWVDLSCQLCKNCFSPYSATNRLHNLACGHFFCLPCLLKLKKEDGKCCLCGNRFSIVYFSKSDELRLREGTAPSEKRLY